MKLTRILANNFLRLNLFDMDLSAATTHIIAGDNEAGKTSVYEAVRLALLGEVVRVSTKGEHKTLVRDGAKTGSVLVVTDQFQIGRDIKTKGSPSIETVNGDDYRPPQYLEYVINAQRFAREKMEIRRKMLFSLTGTAIDPKNIIKRLLVKGCDETRSEEIKPMLRAGFQAAHDAAQKKAVTLRGKWCGLTGQSRYGRNIASDWKPEPPADYDAEGLAILEQSLTENQKFMDKLNTHKGRTEAQIDAAKPLLEQAEKRKDYDPAIKARIEKRIGELRLEIDQLNRECDTINTRISQSTEKVPVTCPECKTKLKVSFITEPGKGTVAQVSPFREATEDELAEMQRQLHTTVNRRRQAQELLDDARAKHAHQSALESLEPATVPDIGKLEKELDKTIHTLAEQTTWHIEAETEARALREAAGRVAGAADDEAKAQQMHQSIQAWEKIYTELAPDGIPAEILADAIKPVNDRLKETARLTGWPVVAVTPQIEITADGRAYQLLSESARWRADAAVAEAIAHLSGLKLLILDRMDVLSIKNRGAFLAWVGKIQSEYDTILILATLKGPPSRLPAGMQAHWLENGELQQVAA